MRVFNLLYTLKKNTLFLYFFDTGTIIMLGTGLQAEYNGHYRTITSDIPAKRSSGTPVRSIEAKPIAAAIGVLL
mgnify:CR=1 FL=1